MPREQRDYLSYLLRLWLDDGETESAWRASLESSLASERQSFASLDDLCAFLWQQTGAAYEENSDEGVTREQCEAQHQPPTTPEQHRSTSCQTRPQRSHSHQPLVRLRSKKEVIACAESERN
jgi:hypothetical protein